MFGYCQPCTGSCSPERIYENFDVGYNFDTISQMPTCVEKCGSHCPRCVMDSLCAQYAFPNIPEPFRITPDFRTSGYNLDETYLQPNGEFSTYYSVPATAYEEGNQAEIDAIYAAQLRDNSTYGPHSPSLGPYPKAGCWYLGGPFSPVQFPNFDTLQRGYLECLKDPAIWLGQKSPSDCG
jgi:hypothetical protein